MRNPMLRKNYASCCIVFACLVALLASLHNVYNAVSLGISYTRNVNGTRSSKINVAGIAKARGLTSPVAVELLDRIAAQKRLEYNRTRDLLVYQHFVKSGGTSLSRILETLGGVVPGSRPSEYFAKHLFDKALQNETNSTTDQWWEAKKVMYSHEMFHNTKGRKTKFANWFLEQVPPTKQVKLLNLIRDPVALIASNFNEWMCLLYKRRFVTAKRLGLVESEAKTLTKKKTCMGLTNVTFLAENWLEFDLIPSCASNETKSERRELECQQYLKTGADPTPHCRSIQNFLNSSIFYGRVHDASKRYITTETDPSSDFEALALQKLSGVGDADPDSISVLWVGTTERLHESACLLHYTLDLEYIETPTRRYRECRPTSVWSEEEMAIVREREAISEAVYKAANAILDIRTAKMCQDLSSASNAQRENKLYVSCCNQYDPMSLRSSQYFHDQ